MSALVPTPVVSPDRAPAVDTGLTRRASITSHHPVPLRVSTFREAYLAVVRWFTVVLLIGVPDYFMTLPPSEFSPVLSGGFTPETWGDYLVRTLKTWGVPDSI